MIEGRADMDGETHERWVAGHDAETGTAKGRPRTGNQAVRFVEVTANGTEELVTRVALHPEIAAAHDAAQMAADEIIGWAETRPPSTGTSARTGGEHLA